MRRQVARLGALAGLTLSVLLLTTGVAAAGGLSGFGGRPSIGNPITGIENKLCPPKNAPTPEMPDSGIPKGTGDYEKYGYAGLTWTTYDQSCLSSAKIDNSTGNVVNDLATGIDGLVNQAQGNALDPHFTDPLRRVVDTSAPKLQAAFLEPWLKYGLAGAGALMMLAWAFGRETEMFRLTLNVFLVLGAVYFVLAAPGQVSQRSADATSGVAAHAGTALAGATGMPVSNPSSAFTDAYYSLSYRAWADGAFCFQRGAEDRWGPRIRNDQAYTVDEAAQIAADPTAADGIKKAKQADWTKAASDMSQTDPAAYDCWSGATSSRFKSGIRHLIASVLAGIWVLLCSIGLLILQDMLMLGVLLLIGVGAVLIAFRRAADRMFEFLLVAAVGAPFVALIMGILLTGYFVIMSDPGISWLSSVILSVSLGAAIWFSRPFLRRLLIGLAAVEQGHRTARHISRAGTTTLAGVGAALGAGAVVGEAVARRQNRRAASGDDPIDPTSSTGSANRSGSNSSSSSDGSGPQLIPGDSRSDPDGRHPVPDLPDDDMRSHWMSDDESFDDDNAWSTDRAFPVPAGHDGDVKTAPGTRQSQRTLSFTEEEEGAWREMASRQLDRFGHPPMSPPPDSDLYRPPPISGDEARDRG